MCFLTQDWVGEKELIIFNTDWDHPIELGASFTDDDRAQIKIVNAVGDYQTGKPYTNTGAIRRDALTHATGTHYISFDDDDVYLPWDFRQRVDGVLAMPPECVAWKPFRSWMIHRDRAPELMFNWLEASMLVDIAWVREQGFRMTTGDEHLGWAEPAWNHGLIEADESAIPGYAMVWADEPEVAGHKQSNMATFGQDDNFERHLRETTDVVNRPLEIPALIDPESLRVGLRIAIDSVFKLNRSRFRKYVLESLS